MVTVTKYVVAVDTAGVTTVNDVELVTVVLVLDAGTTTLRLEGTPPDSSTKFTVVAPGTNPVPVRVRVVPPAIGPLEGLAVARVGAEALNAQLSKSMPSPQVLEHVVESVGLTPGG